MPDIVKSMIKDIETYYNITSVKAGNNNLYVMGNFLNKDVEQSKNTLYLSGVSYEVLGNGTKVINQFPMKGTSVNGKVFLLTNGDKYEIPNITNYSRKNVINLAKLLNIEYSFEGNGYVTSYTVDVNENGKPIKINAILNDKYTE